MKQILNRYETISGQVVNYSKSVVTFSPNTADNTRKVVCSKLGVKEAKHPGKYLGMPMIIGRRKVLAFNFLFERVEQKLQAWDNWIISKAGKVVLLKTIAQSIPNFWMNLLLIPGEICEKIKRRMNAFWWGNKGASRGIRWMAWDKLCEVKEERGLGFKKLRDFNVAMLAKQAWRLVNNANPVVTKLMQAKYYPNSKNLNASMGSNPSYIWRSILETQNLIKQGCRRRIGDGRDTRVWQVPWLPSTENGYVTSVMYDELANVTVNNLLDESLQRWDNDVLKDICNERDRQLIHLIPIPMQIRRDSCF